MEILDLNGKVLWIAWKHVKWVCYVRDFPAGETVNPERLLHKRFPIRPRTAGVWLRMTLTRRRRVGRAGGQRPFAGGGGRAAADPAGHAGQIRSVSMCRVRRFRRWKCWLDRRAVEQGSGGAADCGRTTRPVSGRARHCVGGLLPVQSLR